MWTSENRPRYNRDPLRYPSDVTEEEWSYIAPLIPPARRSGRKRAAEMREVLNGLRYVLGTGGQWRDLPKEFPPRGTGSRYFRGWQRYGTRANIPQVLYAQWREQADRKGEPPAGIIDSQSVKSAEKGGRTSIRTGVTAARTARGRSILSS